MTISSPEKFTFSLNLLPEILGQIDLQQWSEGERVEVG